MRLYYFAAFANVGIIIPYLPLYFQSLGLTPFQIGILTSIAPFGRPFFAGAWTVPAEKMGKRHPALVLAAWLSAAAFVAYLIPTTFWGLALAVLIVAAAQAPVHAFAEAAVLEASRIRGFDYGRVRVWGSAGFVAAAGALGWIIESIPLRSMFWFVIGFGVLVAVSCSMIPRPEPVATERRASLREALRRKGVATFYVATMLMQASHGAYYTFYSVHMAAQGHTGRVIGALWGLGVAAEMVIMVVFSRLARATRPSRVLLACFLLASLRWLACALTASLWVALPAQVLHAFSFGAFHMAAVMATGKIFPAELRASGQAVYSGLTYGLGNVAGAVTAGVLYGTTGPFGLFAISSLIALAGAGLMAQATRRIEGFDGVLEAGKAIL